MSDIFGAWTGQVTSLRAAFETASPFPHLVIDDFLHAEVAETLHEEFPQPGDMPKSRDYMFGDKHELSSVEAQGPVSSRYHHALLSDEFSDALQALTGKMLFVDPLHHGGGFHQGGNGSFLETHVDFNVHPEHRGWLRTLNILLYLPKDWREEYDGALLLRTSPTAEPVRVMPRFNRAVIMLTAGNTYHGYRRMTLPPGVTRKLIATYAYERIEPGSEVARTTGWAPESGVVKQALAKVYDPAVRIKNRYFGSGTSKNR